MIFLTDNSSSVLRYHLKSIQNSSINAFNIETHSNTKASQVNKILLRGDIFNQTKSIITFDAKSKAKEFEKIYLKQNKFNTSYLSFYGVEDKYLFKKVSKKFSTSKNVQIISINEAEVLALFNKYKQIFSRDAFNYIKKYFIDKPTSFEKELFRLVNIYKTSRKILSLEQVVELYEYGQLIPDSRKILYNLGKNATNELIMRCSGGELYGLLIGSDKNPPYIYKLFFNSNSYRIFNKEQKVIIYSCLQYLKQAVEQNLIEIKIGAILFNQWVYELRLNNFKLTKELTDKLLNYLGY